MLSAVFGQGGDMRRADRLFQIIQVLRRSSKPLTADAMAAELETSKRTIYRDIATLMGQRVPIRGEAGLGYVLEGIRWCVEGLGMDTRFVDAYVALTRQYRLGNPLEGRAQAGGTGGVARQPIEIDHGIERAFADMDAWGYSFRLGSARAWFEQDAEDAADYLALLSRHPDLRGVIAGHMNIEAVASSDMTEADRKAFANARPSDSELANDRWED